MYSLMATTFSGSCFSSAFFSFGAEKAMPTKQGTASTMPMKTAASIARFIERSVPEAG
jgi:hypothetical protein